MFNFYGINGYGNIAATDSCRLPLITLDTWYKCIESEVPPIPERWCIKTNDENYNEIISIYPKCYREKSLFVNTYFTSHNISSGDSVFSKYPGENFSIFVKPNSFTEITFEQFKKYILKQTTMKKTGYISLSTILKETGKYVIFIKNLNENSNLKSLGLNICKYKGEHCYSLYGSYSSSSTSTNTGSFGDVIILYPTDIAEYLDKFLKEKEIIGYLSPYDLFDNLIPKGSFFRKSIAEKEKENTYTTDNVSILNALPKEIVETWEPVYKEDEGSTFKVGDILVLKENCNHLNAKKGSICEVTMLPNDKRYIKVKWLYVKCNNPYHQADGGYEKNKFKLANEQDTEISVTMGTLGTPGNTFEVDVNLLNKQVYRSSSNITSFIKELVNHYQKDTFGGYTATTENIIFSKTSCQNKETKLSEWIKVYDMIK